ncbi:LamG-like jellyroll fold domain-containing protein [Kutzneria sp. NPDC052558]|uniref:LamG-like jellyroll fold domain-containing protein n=1 Tax=Kutzneria sp. NPDC052558 TaxID=3364121 RepID=UPI0037C67FDC
MAFRLTALAMVVALALPLLTMSSPPTAVTRQALPLGAATTAPEQSSGSADGLGHAASTSATTTSLASSPHEQPRPANAVPDTASPAPAVHQPGVDQRQTKPTVSQPRTGPVLPPDARERVGDRTATTETFDNPDGSRTLRLHAGQSNVRTPDGSWQPVDLALAMGNDGRARPKLSPIATSFAGHADDPVLAQVDFDGDHGLSYGLVGASAAKAEVAGSQVTYRGVRPGVDLVLSPTASGVKEDLVLASAATASVEFTLRLKGLRPRVDSDGGISLLAGDQVVGVVPAGYMTDGATARSTGVRYTVTPNGPAWTLRMDLDAKWLADPARAYPVVVDPSVGKFHTDADDTFVQPGKPAQSTNQVLEVGKVDGLEARSYLHFGNALGQLRNQYILGASLVLDNIGSSSCTPQSMTVFEVTQPWDGGMTWPGAGVGRALGNASFAHGAAGCPSQAWEGFPLDPDVMTQWTHGNAVANGLSVRATNENDGQGKRFASANAPTQPDDKIPYLDVKYSPDGAAFKVTSITLATNNKEGRMVVNATNWGASAWPAGGAYHLGYVVDGGTTKTDWAPATAVGPGQTATFDVPVIPLPPGSHEIKLSMWGPDGRSFADAQGVPWGVFTMEVHNEPPTTNYQAPGTGAVVETLTPTLYAEGKDPDDWPEKGLSYKFRLCADQALTTDCQESDWGGQSWAPPKPLSWNRTYFWGLKVYDTVDATPDWVELVLTTRVHQPEITSHLAGSPGNTDGPGLDPQIGNYSTVATDASMPTVGPDLTVTRTYNSLDPRRDTAFGEGWSSRVDMRLRPDDDGSGNVVITFPAGRQVRMGRNPDGTFAPPQGAALELVYTGGGAATYTLRDNTGGQWVFDLLGRLTSVFDPAGIEERLGYDTNDHVTTITNQISRRTLSLTWTGSHVSSVQTPAPQLGGAPLTWTYSYTGDRLDKACVPGDAPNCTSYQGKGGSHYLSTVLDDNPRGYWRLDENGGDSFANVTARRPGSDAAQQHGVVLGAGGALDGTTDTAGAFDGNGSYVTLPQKLLAESMSVSAELWFKTTDGGVLLSYADQQFPAAATKSTPVLYVGTDGLLYGGFAMHDPGGARQVVSARQVNDGQWHHAVLSTAVTSQTLYLDGQSAGTITGVVDHGQEGMLTVGAGNGKDWPATNGAGYYFTGSIDEVALYLHTVGALAAQRHFAARGAVDQLTSITLPQDNRQFATLTYDDAHDRVRTLVDNQNRSWTMDTPTVLESLRTAVLHGPSTHGDWTYVEDIDNGGRIVSSSHNGGTKAYRYNEAGFPSGLTDENGNTFTETTDARGNVLSRTSCRAGGSCFTTYSSYVASDSPLDPRRDKLASTSDARSSGPDDTRYRTTYSYDTAGRPTGVVTPRPVGQTAPPALTNVYSTGAEDAVGGGKVPAGLLVTTTGARGQVTTRQYSANGDLVAVLSPTGLRTGYGYDLIGRQTSATTTNSGGADIGTTTIEYTPRSQVSKVTGPAVTNPVTGATHQEVSETRYDGDGNVTQDILSDATPGGDPPRATSYAYDGSDRLTKITDAAGGVETFSYADNGLTVTDKDVRGFSWTTRSDEFGKPLAQLVSGPGVDPDNPDVGTLTIESMAYDPGGRLASVTDAMGRLTTYQYYGDNLLASQTRPNVLHADGTRHDVVLSQVNYDAAGNVVDQIGAGGRRVSQTYDDAGLVATSTVDPGGLSRQVSYQRDADGNPTRVERRGAADRNRVEVTAYSYDAADLVTREDDYLDATTAVSTVYNRDERGLVRSTVDRRGLTTSQDYDANGDPVRTTYPPTDVWVAGVQTKGFARVETVGRNAFGEATQTVDGAGGVTTAAYDPMGRATAVTSPDYTTPGGQTIKATARTEYDAAGNVAKLTDPLGRVTTHTYDAFGRPLTTTLPQVGDQPSTATTHYDRLGEVVSSTDPNGAETKSTYDELGRQATTTQVERTTTPVSYFTTTMGYDEAGDIVSVRSPQGNVATATYNGAGEVTGRVDATGRGTTIDYDIAGRSANDTDTGGVVTTTTYNLLGQPVRTAQSVNGQEQRATTNSFDANGNITGTVSPEGRATTFGYDELNRLAVQTERVDATKSITTTTGYDKLGARSRMVDGNGNATNYTYTSWGLPESVVEPATAATPALADRTWTTGYNAAGKAVSLTKPGGVTTSREYDSQDRITVEHGAGAPDRVFGYDRVGNLTSINSPGGTTTYSYDDRGHLTASAGPAGSSSYSYNGDGTMASRTDASGQATFTYDGVGRLTTVADPLSKRTARYGYDAPGRLSTVTDTAVNGQVSRQIGYDSLGRTTSDKVVQYIDSGVPPRTLLGTEYGYDRDDKLTSKTSTSTVGSTPNGYGYDGAGRLTSWTDGSGQTTNYGWDNAGNRVSAGSQTYSYDQRNQLLSGGGASYSYTPRGTLASVTQNGVTRTSSFDAFDRLINDAGTTYSYDSLNRVADRNGTSFTYSGLSNDVVSDGSRLVSRLPDGTGFSDKATTGSAKMLYADQHDDVVGRYLNASVDGRRSYDPFGAILSSTGDTSSLGFQGSWSDPSSGAVNMAARWYSPTSGQFTSRDDWTVDPQPSAAANRHQYGNTDPVGNVDPSGHDPIVECDAYPAPCIGIVGPADQTVVDELMKIAADQLRQEWFNYALSQPVGCQHRYGKCQDTCVVVGATRCLSSSVGGAGTVPGLPPSPKKPTGGHPTVQHKKPPVIPTPPPPPLWDINLLGPLAAAAAGAFVTLFRAAETAVVDIATSVIDNVLEHIAGDTDITPNPEPNPVRVDRPFPIPLPLPDVKPQPKPDPGPDEDDDEDECLDGSAATDIAVNDPMQQFTWNGQGYYPYKTPGKPTFRATGGHVCLSSTRPSKKRTPYTPVGYQSGDNRSHLIGYQFWGSNGRTNIVPLEETVNQDDMEPVEGTIADAVGKNKNTRIYLDVKAVYVNPNSGTPTAVIIDAVGNGGFSCQVTIVNPPMPGSYPGGRVGTGRAATRTHPTC